MNWRLPLSFAAGVLLAGLGPALPPLLPTLLIWLVRLPLLYWANWRLPLLFLVGAGWFLLQAAWWQGFSWPVERSGERIQVIGTVVGLPESRGQSLRFELQPDRGQAEALPHRIAVSWYRQLEYIRPGQRSALTLRM
ncbi:MAG: DUF4131 domain-containing protein, partial [Wenzhouxiangella sp.]|nr:DUF4131 domain-containing protein [Wenzhouxiangella sp.]